MHKYGRQKFLPVKIERGSPQSLKFTSLTKETSQRTFDNSFSAISKPSLFKARELKTKKKTITMQLGQASFVSVSKRNSLDPAGVCRFHRFEVFVEE